MFKKKIVIVAIVAFVALIGAVVLIMWQLNSAHVSSVAALQNVVAPTPTPHVSFVLVKTKNGNRIAVSWSDLPGGTQTLDIFLSLASKNGIQGSSTLWQTITLSADELANGSRQIDVGTSTFAGDSFYAQAVGAGGEPLTNTSGTPSGPGTVLWTSSSTLPEDATSTPPANNPPPPSNPNPTSTPPANPVTPPNTPTSTNQNPTPSSTNQNPTSTGNNPPPTGIPYYNPQNQLTGYGPYQGGNFWVQEVNGAIEVGWQNLQSGLTSLTISRSSNQNGPWSELMTQGNPAPSSTYTFQVVDSSVNTPQYYMMTVFEGSTLVATYGPDYLAPGQ